MIFIMIMNQILFLADLMNFLKMVKKFENSKTENHKTSVKLIR